MKIVGSDCKTSLPEGFSNIQWLDDSRLLASTYWARCDDWTDANPKKFETQAILFDMKGTILATANSHASMYTKGIGDKVADALTGTRWITVIDPTITPR